ncbi:MAG TPA: sigma 54-interacting transcriptional regulator, partial [Planctomycetia bacterium]|nr:sigma 54-interacting transcriptional regulator [Planctomycetia bacterium]
MPKKLDAAHFFGTESTAAGEPVSSSVVHDDLRALHAVVEGTARGTGEEFFQSLVRHLAEAIDVNYAVVAEFPDAPPFVRTLAVWERDRVGANFEYDFTGTPCAEVVRGGLVHYPSGVSKLFPGAAPLVERGIDGYMALPFLDRTGAILGHLAVFDDRPMPAEPRRGFIFRIFAARATAEQERMRAEQRLSASEARYRDLYENAPSGYAVMAADARILRVNRRFCEMLGFPSEELVGACFLSLLPETPAGRRAGEEMHRKHLAGEGVFDWELEIRRKDGRPAWIKVWMEPDRGADGSVHSCRMFCVDVTDRVLADRESARLHAQNEYLQEEIKADRDFESIVGRSAPLRDALAQVALVAPTEASVLITGETGTGKELIARAIHSASKRKDKPYVKVNCAALPSGLVESELFGHEKGAFTGAIAKRLGRFESADGGTIFLDEIGELPAEAQVKLLRVLQEREIDRVGGDSPIKVDVRVIAATNRDLTKEIQEKRFREDLYYRLNVFPIRLPPLRDRRDDVPLLVQFLVRKFSLRIGKRLEKIGEATMRRLMDYPWPGNIRELENVLERAVILATEETLEIGPDFLPLSSAAGAPEAAPPPALEPASPDHLLAVPLLTADERHPSLESVERNFILTTIERANWVITG